MDLRNGLLLVLITLVPAILFGQPGTITTVAGAWPLGDGGPATQARVTTPTNLAVDKDGSVYIMDFNRIRRVNPDGTIQTVVGTGYAGGLVEGPGTETPFNGTIGNGMALAADGTLYFISDLNNLAALGTDGRVRRVAGFGTNPAPGPAFGTALGYVGGLAVDSAGAVFMADIITARIYKLPKGGPISVIAGTGAEGFSGDGGPATKAQLDHPRSLAFDSVGNLFVADWGNNRVRKISPDGSITTVAGSDGAVQPGADPALATSLNLNNINYVAVDANDVVYVACGYGPIWTVYKVDTAGRATRISALDSLGTTQSLGVAVDRLGNVYSGRNVAGQVWKASPSGDVALFAGASQISNQNGPPLYARLNLPGQLAVDSAGNTLVTEAASQTLRKITPAGVVTLGTVNNPAGIAPAPDGGFFVSDSARSSIRKFAPDGTQSLYAGLGQWGGREGFSGDGGPATKAQFNLTFGIATDAAGNLFVADVRNHRIRRIDTTGIVTTVAGNGTQGFAGDGGPATSAQLNFPNDVFVDSGGNLYIADCANHRIRKVAPDGTITTVGGSGKSTFDGDGVPALKGGLPGPRRVVADAFGNLFVQDSSDRIRKITRQGILTTVAGNGRSGFSGDGGPATKASISMNSTNYSQSAVAGFTIDANGNLLLADSVNHHIRRVQGSAPFAANPENLSFITALGAGVQTKTFTLGSGDGDPHDFRISLTAPWLQVSPFSGSVDPGSSVTLTVMANPTGLPKGRYNTKIVFTDPTTGFATEVPVTMLISGTPQQLKLGQTGLTFTAVQGGGAPTDQTVRVLNTGIGGMNWTAAVSTLSGGAWLRVSPSQGRTDATGVAPAVQVGVNASILAAGTYFGLVTVTAPGVDNSPQSAVAVLNVLRADGSPGPQVDPTGAIVISAPGGKPATQTVTITNLVSRTINYTTSLSFPDQKQWFTATASNGAINAGQSARITVTPNVGTIPVGVYRGDLSIRFTPDNITRVVNLILVVADGATASTSGKLPERSADIACTAKRLIPVFLQPGAGFSATAGWPASLEARIVDDCGRAVTSGSAQVNFSTNDPPVALTSSGDGRWTGTWTARTPRASGVNISVLAETDTAPKLNGTAQITGGVRANAEQPIIDREGFLDLAAMRRGDPVAVGSLAAVLGASLAADAKEADSFPLPELLSDTRAVLGGRAMPLRRTSAGRLEAQVPWGSADNTPIQLIVQRGRSYSPPEEVYLTATNVGIYAVQGKNQGLVYGRDDDGTLTLADEAAPVKPGQTIVIMATGLGPVQPNVAAGAPGPDDPLAKITTPVTLTIADKDAEIQEAVLAPGLVGVYRITATVPGGLEPSASARVVLTVNGQSSAPVIMSVGDRSSPDPSQ